MAEANESADRWLDAARAGSLDALGQALEACRGYLLLIARQELATELQAKGGASDLVQETLLEGFKGFNRFQGRTDEDLRQWLRRLLLNNLLDFTRHFRGTAKRQLDRESPLDDAGSSAEGLQLAGAFPSPSEEVLAGEQAEAVQKALAQLPADYRRVLVWRYQESRSFEEIGAALDLTANAARKLLLRALRRVQQDLGEP